MDVEKLTTIINNQPNSQSNTNNQLLIQLLIEIGNLREVVNTQQTKINQLEAQLTNAVVAEAVPPAKINTTLPNLNRRRLLKGLAASLALGAGTTVAVVSGEKAAQAKLIASPIPAIGALVTPRGTGELTYTGALLDPNNTYGMVGVSDTTAFDLAKLPEVASCGVFGYSSNGAGVYGKAGDGWGIKGEGSNTGFGVSGTAVGNGVGIISGSDTGIGILAQSGVGVPLKIAPSEEGVPVLPPGDTGSFYVNPTSNKLFFSKNGVWKEVLTDA